MTCNAGAARIQQVLVLTKILTAKQSAETEQDVVTLYKLFFFNEGHD